MPPRRSSGEWLRAPLDLVDDLPTSGGPRYYAHYEDDGPSGPCGQGFSTTKPWNRLYVFTDPKAWLDFQHDVQVETFRLNARVTGAWADGDDHYEPVSTLGAPLR